MSSAVFLKNFLLIFVGFIFLPFAAIKSFGQVNEIKDNYAKNNLYNLREKIFLHTDRSFYVCGEILWFKAYLTNAANNKPLSISKVMYVEVLNTLHQPILQGKVAITNGTGDGSFLLPFSLASGNYEVRAYTNWMKNFSVGNFFKKNITVINTTRNLDSSIIHQQVNYSVNFFPEGGNLVDGLQSEIAFKVVDNKNKGVDCGGIIVGQKNDTLVHFKTLHAGMGHFYLTPEMGKEYTAVITCEDGNVIKKKLPATYATGYVMHVADSSANNLKISVASKDENNTQEIFIILQNNGRMSFAKSMHLENGKAFLLLPKDSLKDGVTQVTVFNTNKQPQCERLYFKKPKNKLLITAEADKNTYQLRNKIAINISTADAVKNSLAANLSVSVFRLDSLHQPEQEDIFSYLWLSSYLQGAVENAAYYFNNEDAETGEAIDNLLLAQGWRKFDGTVIKNSRPSFTYVPEYTGHIITGRITNAVTKKPVKDVLVYLSVPGRRVQLRGCASDSAGLVYFNMKDFIGSTQIVLQTNTGVDSIYHLEIFTPFSEEITGDVIPSLSVSEKDGDHLQNENFHMEVENGYHEKELQQEALLLIDTLPFYQKPDNTYLLDNYTRFTTMEEVLREYVDQISVRRNGKEYRLMALNQPAVNLQNKQPVELMFKDNPLILLDGVPVFKMDKIINYDPLKVQKLEVVASKYYWGPVAADGIASFTTYKGNLDGYTLDPNDLVLDYEALQQQRVFYSPDYSSTEARQNRLPDYRDVLYWSPEINTGGDGKGSFSFYTGDIPGKYFVVAQGISSNGDAGSTGIIVNVAK